MSDNASVQVEIEKELRRQLLEVDEHSSHQGRQLERLQEHTVAMHALAPGMLPALPGLYSSYCIATHPLIFPTRYQHFGSACFVSRNAVSTTLPVKQPTSQLLAC